MTKGSFLYLTILVACWTLRMGLLRAEPPVLSSQYGAPSRQFGGGSSYAPPSNHYGAPSHTTASFGSSPGGHYGHSGGGGGGGSGYGFGGGYQDDYSSEPANYEFQYHVQDPQSGNDFGHQESRQGDVVTGKYFVLLPDGRRQVVEYIADQHGYRPKITYENVGGGYGATGHGGGYNGGGGYY